jgi:carbon-monoxide dehydrogenase iron sulfur subunit
MIHCNTVLCVGCRMCEVACSTFHFGAVSPALSRIRVVKLEAIGIDLAIACMSCEEKPCLECPSEALSVGGSGLIVLERDLCNACETCVEVCPVGAVGFFDEEPLFCDLCGGAAPCIEVCPTGALSNRDARVSLAPYLQNEGRPCEKRALFAEHLATPIRQGWMQGVRVDS